MLADLMAGAAADARSRRADCPLDVLQARAALAPAPRDAVAALAPADHVKIIAEVKRASPSRGHLADIPDPAQLAASYELGGASAVSVLTEGRKFKGSLADLESVRNTVDIPILRKDFISDPYQLVEARAAGADIVLLIVAGLDQELLRDLHELTREMGMAALVETHSAAEVDRALDIGAEIIGVNARNLSTFEIDSSLFGTLAPQIPSGIVRVAESAVVAPDDVRAYRQAGADVVLVGEALVTNDPVSTLNEFLAVG